MAIQGKVLSAIVVGGVLSGWLFFSLSFVSRCSSSRESEARSNLKSWCIGERAHWQERSRRSESFHEIGFSPERGNRYTYFASDHVDMIVRRTALKDPVRPLANALGADEFKYGAKQTVRREQLPHQFAGHKSLGLHRRCPECDIMMVAGANLDDDPALDIWSISTGERTLGNGSLVHRCEPFQEWSDRTEINVMFDFPPLLRTTSVFSTPQRRVLAARRTGRPPASRALVAYEEADGARLPSID